VWLGLPAGRFQSGGNCRIHAARRALGKDISVHVLPCLVDSQEVVVFDNCLLVNYKKMVNSCHAE